MTSGKWIPKKVKKKKTAVEILSLPPVLENTHTKKEKGKKKLCFPHRNPTRYRFGGGGGAGLGFEHHSPWVMAHHTEDHSR